MEYDELDQNEDGGFLSRLRESPRTVSVLIIILIVAAAIYAFSDNQDQTPVADVEEVTEEAMIDEADEGGTGEEMAGAIAEDTTQPPREVSPEVLAEQNRALPAGERTNEGYVETAQSGDGITHLARRAATRYIAEQETSYAVTNEHRIYIEDYIKDNLGKRGLALEEQVTIPLELMQEATTAAGELTPQQLHNLSQYTYVLQ